jgi:hypothetical protein
MYTSYILKQQLSVCDGRFGGWGKGEPGEARGRGGQHGRGGTGGEGPGGGGGPARAGGGPPPGPAQFCPKLKTKLKKRMKIIHKKTKYQSSFSHGNWSSQKFDLNFGFALCVLSLLLILSITKQSNLFVLFCFSCWCY